MDRLFIKRLTLGHASIVLVIVLSTTTAWLALRSTLQQTAKTSEIDGALASIDHLRGDARELARSARRYLLSAELKEQQRVFAIETEMDQERTHLGVSSPKLDRALDEYISTVIRTMSADRSDPSATIVRFEESLVAVRDQLATAFDDLVKQNRTARDAARSSQGLARGAQWALLIAGALGVLLTLGSILGVLSLLHRHAERIQNAEKVAQSAVTARKELLAASSDLRDPLERIVTQALELRRQTTDESQHRVLLAIANSASLVNSLMRQLLDVTAVQEGRVSLLRESCDVADLIDRALRHHRDRAAARGMRLRYSSQVSMSVSADRERIGKAFTTLLGTAIETARIGAVLVIGASRIDDGVRFEIVDAELSVPLPSSFQPAVVVPPNDIAVHLTRRVVEAHGGHMGVDATAAGRTYWFTLPTEPSILT